MRGRISLETNISIGRDMGGGATKEVGMRGIVFKRNSVFWGYLLLGHDLYILYIPYCIQLPQ